MLTLITGGIKSGKSRKALEIARKEFPEECYFLATAECTDDEMKERIIRHRRERGKAFKTLEEPVDIHRFRKTPVVLDCVTVWVNNLMYYSKEDQWRIILDDFLTGCKGNAVIVTNETGLGVIPVDPLARRYNRLLGEVNAYIAEKADSVLFMVAGIPLKVK